MTGRPAGYDVIGDVHGHAAKLRALLARLGYEDTGGSWRHPEREAIFVGDLIDRGPEQVGCYRIARRMVEAGAARVLVGNHEFNAIAYATPDADAPGEFLRRHSDKNQDQHGAFLDQAGWESPEHREMLDWFMTLPLWLDLGGLRVVHACWDQAAIDAIRPATGDGDTLTPDLVAASSRKGTPEWRAIEHLLKGPEADVPEPYLDKGGHLRNAARITWWDPGATTLRSAAIIPQRTLDGGYPELPATPLDPGLPRYTDDVPVFFGHYWRSGTPTVMSAHAACVDYSAGGHGPLVAYRWSGEQILTDANFVTSDGSS